MLRKLAIVVGLAAALSGCARVSESRLNPLNWFNPAPATTNEAAIQRKPLVPTQTEVTVVDARVLIESLVSASLETSGSGAILRATGVAASQGYFNAELVLVGASNGVLTYDFSVERPAGYEAVGSANSRQITVATVIDAAVLRGVKAVDVRGANGTKRLSR